MEVTDGHAPRPSGDDRFATTHWSLVLAAGERADEKSHRALEQLCRAYWPPLYAYARRRVGDIHEAQDLTQAFFERLLDKRYLAHADPGRGRFRAFLITAFRNFMTNEWDRAKAQKRGGGMTRVSLDFAAYDQKCNALQDRWTPERLYDRQWAVTLLNRVMGRLQREMERSGKGRQFQLLKGFIAGSDGSRYSAAAAELGVGEAAARMAASRVRQRYLALLRQEIAQTVAAEDEIDSEVQHLFAALAD